MTPTELTVEVATRLGVSAKGAHVRYFVPAGEQFYCEVLGREIFGSQVIETVWTIGATEPSMAGARAEAISSQLVNRLPEKRVYRRDCPVYRYVGLVSIVPESPDAAFFDAVAERAVMVRDGVDWTTLP